MSDLRERPESGRPIGGRLARSARRRLEGWRRFFADRGEREVFPWMEHATAAGALVGLSASLALGLAFGIAPDRLIPVMILGATAGALAGIAAAVTWAAIPPSIVSVPEPEATDLWDAWLDDAGGDGEATSEPAQDDEPAQEVTEERLPVRPRVLSRESGESVPLEDELGPILAKHERGAIQLVGPAGSGKSTALAYLARRLPPHFGVVYLDGPDPRALDKAAARAPVIFAGSTDGSTELLASMELAPWERDEWIEYLLACDRGACASVMARIAASGREDGLLEGIPELWKVVLDRMSRHEWVRGPREALRLELHSRLADPDSWPLVAGDCMAALLVPRSQEYRIDEHLRRHEPNDELLRLIRHRPAQLVLAADGLVDDLAHGRPVGSLHRTLPLDLVREAASRLGSEPAAVERLVQLVADPDETLPHAMAASLLHALGSGWKPGSNPVPCLAGAYLSHADWGNIRLTFARLEQADLRRANLWDAQLGGSRLDNARLTGANLRHAGFEFARFNGADLRGARLCNTRGHRATFGSASLEGADLIKAALDEASFERANLTGARLTGASLTGAILRGATLADTDLRNADLSGAELIGLDLAGARLDGACFARANLLGCNLEGVALPGADFSGAILSEALLTGSNLRGADLRGACLERAGLAEVDWEGADLRGADLREADFHLGSSRNGLVGSPIACEGSRTGFYTDEFHEQDFKSPEEIRKANLRGADLRGALIEGADFYLVDLRDARLDVDQIAYLRRTGAILESRA